MDLGILGFRLHFVFLFQTLEREGAGNNGVFGALGEIIGAVRSLLQLYNPNQRSDGYIAIVDR
jgi:hypothetical protein